MVIEGWMIVASGVFVLWFVIATFIMPEEVRHKVEHVDGPEGPFAIRFGCSDEYAQTGIQSQREARARALELEAQAVRERR